MLLAFPSLPRPSLLAIAAPCALSQDVTGRKAEIAGNNAGYCSFYSSLTGPGSIANPDLRTLYLKIGENALNSLLLLIV